MCRRQENKREDDPIGVIAIDADYSPIKKVRCEVKPTRVAQRVDYERLELDVKTDGSVSPESAMTEAAQILRDHVNFFLDMDVLAAEEQYTPRNDRQSAFARSLMMQPVEDLELSVRAQNCLKAANIKTIGELVQRDHSAMLKFRNFGRKSLQELERVLEKTWVGLWHDPGRVRRY